jgi:hypothetical protein
MAKAGSTNAEALDSAVSKQAGERPAIYSGLSPMICTASAKSFLSALNRSAT